MVLGGVIEGQGASLRRPDRPLIDMVVRAHAYLEAPTDGQGWVARMLHNALAPTRKMSAACCRLLEIVVEEAECVLHGAGFDDGQPISGDSDYR